MFLTSGSSSPLPLLWVRFDNPPRYLCMRFETDFTLETVAQALLFVKGYVEIYAGKLKKQKVSYASFPRSTHVAILLILLSSLAYHIALWPAYGAKTMLIMFLFAMFLLHFCLLFPTYVQNLVAFIVLGFFLQEYK